MVPYSRGMVLNRFEIIDASQHELPSVINKPINEVKCRFTGEDGMISVVMPAYNSEEYIISAIQSILDQTYTNFEFFIIDDGSTDRTPEIIQEFAKRDNRIIVLQGKHQGVGHAMNLGIEHAKYPWIAVMHADDIAMPNRLECQLEFAQTDPEVVIWGSDGFHINANDEVLSRFRVGPTSKEDCRQMRADGKMVQAIHPTVTLKRDIVLKVGNYNPDFDVCEDVELFDRMLCHGDLVTIKENLMKYRIHGTSLSMERNEKVNYLSRYVIARQMHRNETGEELSLDTFQRQYKQRPPLQKFKEYRHRMANFYYRNAGMAFGEKNYLRTAYFLILSASLRPMYPIQRVWKQVLSPEARQRTRLAKT